MFVSKMFRNIYLVNVLHQSRKNISSLSRISNILNSNQEKLSKLRVGSRYINNHNMRYENLSSGSVTRTAICHKYLRLIKNAIRDSGPVAELNPRLAHLLEKAQKNNLPAEFIDFATKISCDVRAKVGLYDLLLPSGCHFLIQYEDIDSTLTKHHILELCEKHDGTLIQYDSLWSRSFEQRGIVLVEHKESDVFSNLSKENIFRIGIQSFDKETDIEGGTYWKFYCDPWQLPKVKEQLSEISNSIEEAFVGFVPKKKIVPSHHIKKYIINMFLKLCEVPTIDKVYTNTSIV